MMFEIHFNPQDQTNVTAVQFLYLRCHFPVSHIDWFCSRSSSYRRLVIPPPSKTVLFGERSFAVGGPSLWNHLLDNIKETGSIELFKQRLKTHLFRQSFEIPAFS